MSAYRTYAQHVSMTPQTAPIPGREPEMASNNAGGYGFSVDDWERLERFLILGSDGGTYYVGEQKLTADNAAVVVRCLKADGRRTIAAALDVNLHNRAPKVDQQLFVLALGLKHGDNGTKAAVADAAPKMLRTGTHLLHFVAMLDGLGGWNRSKRRIVSRWFMDRGEDGLAYQVLKYQSRDGWTMRDVLRVAHPIAQTMEHKAAFDWICGRDADVEHLPALLKSHTLMLEAAKTSPVGAALAAIQAGLPREALPTEVLADPAVWRALLPATPLHALIRNLGTLSANGVLTNGSPDVVAVTAKLGDRNQIHKSRVHPFAILLATLVYRSGQGIRGGKTWVPVPAILSALEDAYDAAFANISPTGKRILVAIDASGSMSSAQCIGMPLACSTAATAMAITLARAEPNAVVVQFDTAVQRIVPVTKRTGIASIVAANGGGTDLAAPILWASGRAATISWGRSGPGLAPSSQAFDAIVLLTDNETWAGQVHASEALEAYRRKHGSAKLICCAMAANHVAVVDQRDPLSMGCAGLDATLPAIVADFIAR